MSSFHKLTNNGITISGTKTKNNLNFVSSGIPSLDYVIGGGLPSGAIFVVEEDFLGNYSRILNKYFLAEGIICNHMLFIASADVAPQDIVKELPQPCNAPVEDEVTRTSKNVDKMKIAWRYEGLSQVESSFGSDANFGHHFDLSKHIDAETIDKYNIFYHFLEPSENTSKGTGFKNGIYYTLLTKIANSIKDFKTDGLQEKNFLRISIPSLGSPTWMAMDCDDNTQENFGQDLLKFMFCLRTIIRDTNAAAFITIPSHLFDDDHLMRRLLYSVDNAVRLESFTGSSKEANPVYKDYHGLFHITKLSALHSMVPFVPPSLDMAFKLKRKKFVIEKLHLPPELQESSEREQDDITSTPYTCGGMKKKNIDF